MELFTFDICITMEMSTHEILRIYKWKLLRMQQFDYFVY